MFSATAHRVFACSEACQRVHVSCRGCGVLEGPDHFHRIRDGYCFALLSEDPDGGPERTVLIQRSCWNVFGANRSLSIGVGVA